MIFTLQEIICVAEPTFLIVPQTEMQLLNVNLSSVKLDAGIS